MKLLALIAALMASPSGGGARPFLQAGGLELSREGYQLILDHEVGGGAAYYDRYLKRPTWPGGASGVTIGVGYDLGYNTREQIARDWHRLSPDVVARLQSVAGLKGQSAHYKAKTLASIAIPWDIAREVYESSTIPRFAAATIRAYPGVEATHPHVQSALLSWVFNRGPGISPTSSRDREKRAIRSDLGAGLVRPLPGHFRASKRLWIGRGLDGLIRRREAEARLIEASF